MGIENKKESTLASDSLITSDDRIRMVGSDGKSYTNNINDVADYINDRVIIPIDNTLSSTGVSADAKATGDEISRVEAIASRDFEFPSDFKTALLACFQHVAWVDTEGQTYYNALVESLE